MWRKREENGSRAEAAFPVRVCVCVCVSVVCLTPLNGHVSVFGRSVNDEYERGEWEPERVSQSHRDCRCASGVRMRREKREERESGDEMHSCTDSNSLSLSLCLTAMHTQPNLLLPLPVRSMCLHLLF